jgi:hypothetical protein
MVKRAHHLLYSNSIISYEGTWVSLLSIVIDISLTIVDLVFICIYIYIYIYILDIGFKSCLPRKLSCMYRIILDMDHSWRHVTTLFFGPRRGSLLETCHNSLL